VEQYLRRHLERRLVLRLGATLLEGHKDFAPACADSGRFFARLYGK